ncbi:2-dehydro-3-deoxygluconokinase [Abditibacterium utsteinense]|uniref:2-dehydro-3-deoxygluconokinase n=2 Tax=Abditibacterium utsteinense TaxID=1960156 RepID=A0A2S8SR74_9BACT|nr:sugar kinase [Abditibacterium utsteinense]PQV63278.1 2-dehydro-3-deoxygluconokinase [Abditibacterium utsteinense]
MKIVTFGEIMMRLATPARLRFSQARELELTYGGGEANVAVSLCNFGLDAAFVSKLPNNPFGDAAIATLRGLGVDTSHIARGGERIGVYFLETGASQRASVVVYDRANSAISGVLAGEFAWEKIFAGASWFHFTGITPALGPDVAAATKEAARAAKEMGLTVSCDLNYRKKLWTPAQAQSAMSEIMEFVDVAIGNEEDAEKVFGIKAQNTDVAGGEIGHASYEEVARTLAAKFGFQSVAITLRESFSADKNGWSAMLLHQNEILHSKRYELQIVDRVGGGDSFAGGLIYGLATAKSGQDALEFAVAASCLKHSVAGDFNLVSVGEVEALAGGDGSGRVQR